MTILYGSETGTAQDTAERIWKSAKRLFTIESIYLKNIRFVPFRELVDFPLYIFFVDD